MGIDAERVEPVGIMRRERLLRVIACVTLIGMAGCLYALFVVRTGLAIPCIFHLVTGYQCPGCGVTRMCVALLQMDFAKAYASNPVLFVLTPIMVLVFLPYVAGYVRNGRWEMNRLQNVVLYLCIVVLIGFGIFRNIIA